MAVSLTLTETLSLLSLFGACVGILANTLQGDGEPLVASLAFSGIAFSSTYSLIVWLGNTFMKAGIKGKDMGKLRKVEMLVAHARSWEKLANQKISDRSVWAQYVRSCI